MNDCIFCKIINGEIPCFKIYEDEHFIAFLDRFPAVRGHVLVLPKKHVEDVFSSELTEEISAKLFPLVTKIAARVNEVLKPDGVNILQNNGATAGQTVKHLHVHIIPRYEIDNVNITWPPMNPTLEELEKIMNGLKI